MPPAAKWRLSRTLKRHIEYRPIEDGDLKYIWAAYKKGAFKEMGFRDNLTPEEFKIAFSDIVVSNCHMAWLLAANTNNGFIPVGVVLCAWAPGAAYLIVIGVSWMPWASKRNIIECMVGFFSKARKDHNFVGYALPEHKRMYEVCCMHGITRRVGTSYIAIPGKVAAVFETRKPD